MAKMNIAILRGGPSSEYDASLKSGLHIINAMSDKYQAHDIFISRDGIWHRDGFERTPERALSRIDGVVNALHGSFATNGQVQKILDSLGIPYTGTSAINSAVASNKNLTKKTLQQQGIKSPYHILVRSTDNVPEKVDYIFHHFFTPFIVKPASGSGSEGVSLVNNFADTEDAVRKALIFSDAILVEEYVRGKEAVAGVVKDFRGHDYYPLMPIEIIQPRTHQFSYKIREPGNFEHKHPGNFTPEEKVQLQRLAKTIHQTLGLGHYSQSDFIITPRRGIFHIDTNTNPHLHTDSMFVQSLEAIGSDLTAFIDHILDIALA